MDPSVQASIQIAAPTQLATEAETRPTAPVPQSPKLPAEISSASAPAPMTAAVAESPSTERQNNVEAAPQPASENLNGSSGRQVNITDALSYLDVVKAHFHDRPHVYYAFLDIMKDFRNQV